jgi:hypothetical protein
MRQTNNRDSLGYYELPLQRKLTYPRPINTHQSDIEAVFEVMVPDFKGLFGGL